MTRIWKRSQHWIISKINQSYQRSKVMLCIRGLQPGYRNNIFLHQCSTIIRYLRGTQLRGLRQSYFTAIGRACTALMAKPEAMIFSDKSHVMSVCGICFGGYCVYSFQQVVSLCILLAQKWQLVNYNAFSLFCQQCVMLWYPGEGSSKRILM